VIEHEAQAILHVDRAVSKVLTGKTIDVCRGHRGRALRAAEGTAGLKGYRADEAERGREMAKIFRCGDLIPGCNAVIEGQDESEVMAKGAEHAKQAHGITSIPPAVAAKVRAAIRER
jgi:predicted small metal-binding protein